MAAINEARAYINPQQSISMPIASGSFNSDPNEVSDNPMLEIMQDTLVKKITDILVNRNINRQQSYSTNSNFNGMLMINRKLNDDGRGQYLGQFDTNDKVLAIFSNGTFYTTSFDLSSKYQGDVLKIEKFDPNKTYTVLYWDAAAKSFYVKRFSFIVSENNPLYFISDSKGSKLVDISEDRHPQILVTFAGKYEHREAEKIDAEEYIGKKGYSAKGKKCHSLDLKTVEFIEPLVKPEDLEEPAETEPQNLADDIEADDIIDINEVDISDVDITTVEVPPVNDDDELTLF